MDPSIALPPASSGPLDSYEKIIVVHGILSFLGFLVLMPAGALVARYMRVYSPRWFRLHWILQLAIGGPITAVGFAIGHVGVPSGHGASDFHRNLGHALIGLWVVQLVLGAIIHYIKPKRRPVTGHPAQNYLHAVIGISIIALSFWQVRDGYRNQWPNVTGRGSISSAADVVWYIWVVVIPSAYIIGLALLPKQFRQEAFAKEAPFDEIKMDGPKMDGVTKA